MLTRSGRRQIPRLTVSHPTKNVCFVVLLPPSPPSPAGVFGAATPRPGERVWGAGAPQNKSRGGLRGGSPQGEQKHKRNEPNGQRRYRKIFARRPVLACILLDSSRSDVN